MDPDHTPRFAASYLGRHCLPMSFLWDASHIWVKKQLPRKLNMYKFQCLTYLCLASHKWSLGKHCRPRTETAASDKGSLCTVFSWIPTGISA